MQPHGDLRRPMHRRVRRSGDATLSGEDTLWRRMVTVAAHGRVRGTKGSTRWSTYVPNTPTTRWATVATSFADGAPRTSSSTCVTGPPAGAKKGRAGREARRCGSRAGESAAWQAAQTVRSRGTQQEGRVAEVVAFGYLSMLNTLCFSARHTRLSTPSNRTLFWNLKPLESVRTKKRR